MPLMKSKSKAAFGKNVSAEMDAGKPQKQAVAISYAVKRKASGHPSATHDAHQKMAHGQMHNALQKGRAYQKD